MRAFSKVARGVSAALAAAVIGGACPALAAGSLSEFLSKKIEEAHVAASQRQFELALSIYQQAIDSQGGASAGTRRGWMVPLAPGPSGEAERV